MKLKLGTRGSALALAQVKLVGELLKTKVPGLELETVVIKTSGDILSARDQDLPKDASSRKGLYDAGKALFVKEIEEALLSRKIDFAVHSAKDLPAEIPAGLSLAAFPEREDPRDVFIGAHGLKWADLKVGMKVATSALRRREQLLESKPGVEAVPVRGNVDTRLRKLDEQGFDGLLLAWAGLKRLGRLDVPHDILPVEVMLPAPAQGAMAIEACADNPGVLKVLAHLDHAPTREAVEWERALLRALNAGCATPLGCLAQAEGKGMRLSVFYVHAPGANPVRVSEAGARNERESFIASMAQRLKSQ